MTASGHARARQGYGRSLVRRYQYLPDRLQTINRTLRPDDYAFDDIGERSPQPGIEAVTPLGHPWHYRIQYASSYANGAGEFCGFSDGFFICFYECEFAEPQQLAVSAPDMLRIRIATRGKGEYCVGDRTIDFDGPSALLFIDPLEASTALAAVEGPSRAVQLYIGRQVLKTLFDGDEGDLPEALRSFLAGQLESSVVQRLPLTPPLLRCLEDLLGCDREGRTRRYYIQSKAMEILCETFAAMGEQDRLGAAETSAIISRGVSKAQAILVENFVSPPLLDDLAAAVGLCRTNLTAGFRSILGQTVYEYIQELRMQHALVLLNEPGSSITQVAYAVGYNHASSFSVAVQKHFGATPSELRRRTAPLTI
jgi:AraC-like DNA-binding protein